MFQTPHKRIVVALTATLVLSMTTACVRDVSVESPDGRIVVTLELDADGRPGYSVSLEGRNLIDRSNLGIEFASGASLQGPYRIAATTISSTDSVWEQPWGERWHVTDRHNEMLATLESATDHDTFNIRVRVFDDGVGFRYELSGDGDVEIQAETTAFNIASDGTAWWQPAAGETRYEHLYRETPLDEVESAHTPVTMVLDSGTHLSFHEAALTDYASYSFAPSGNGGFVTALRPWSDGMAVRTSRPFVTPWRTIQIADDASGLVNSSLILNLNEPNVLGDVSWIEPGKYVGIWWAMHLGLKTWEAGPRHGATTAEAKRYIDFAAKNGFNGVLVEGWNRGWHGPFSYTEAYPDYDLGAVTDYARERNVFIIGHHETYGDVASYEEQMEQGLEVLAAAGIPQVKTGYVADAGKLRRIDEQGGEHFEWHDGQFAVSHQLRNVRAAAARRIAVNTHEPVKDTGLRRTYPNWLTREGSRGQEFAIWGETPNPPDHTVLLAHTRLLAGPMDFTPGIFDLHPQRGDVPRRVQTTLAKQLALYVVIYSPMQMVPDLPENYAARPDAFQFIVDVPTDWDESTALAGEVGEYTVMARKERGGDNWYVGAITDEQARTMSLSLTMLDDDIDYIATVYRDGDSAHWDTNPYALIIEEKVFTKNSTLELQLAAGGGTAIRFQPQKKATKE